MTAFVQGYQYYKYGYCRYQETCRYEHVHELCVNSNCVVRSCPNRHPKACKYFKELQHCRFGSSCQYKHEIQNNTRNWEHDEMAELSSKVKSLEESIAKIVKENDDLQSTKKIESNLRDPSKSIVDEVSSNEALLIAPLVSVSEIVNEAEIDREDCQDNWISRRVALGLGSAFPAWSFKTP